MVMATVPGDAAQPAAVVSNLRDDGSRDRDQPRSCG